MTVSLLSDELLTAVPFSMDVGNTFPPDGVNFVNTWTTLTGSGSDTFQVDPPPDDNFVYIGVGDFGTPADFTIAWYFAVTSIRGFCIAFNDDALTPAPLWTRLGSFLYSHGETFYNFQGLRGYKDKFHPSWEPRYLAYPGGLTLARTLADVAALIAGGYRRILLK